MIGKFTFCKKQLLFCIFLIGNALAADAQSVETDSLKILLSDYKISDERELQLRNELSFWQVNNNPNEALINADKAIVIAQKLKLKSELAVALNNKGFILIRKSRYDDAKIFLKKALILNQELSNQKGIADNFTNTAEILRRQGETDSAKKVFEKALNIYNLVSDKNGIGDVYYYLSLVYRDLSENNLSLDYTDKAIEIYNMCGNDNGLALALNAKGGYYYRTGNIKKAIEIGKQALEINDSTGNLYGISLDVGNLAIDYADLSDYPKSIELNLKAIRIDEQMGNLHLLANDYILIGTSYIEINQYQKALIYIKKGIDLFETLKINNGQYRMGCNYLGIAYLKLNELQKAFANLYKALEVNIKAKDEWALSDSYVHLGDAYLQTGNYDSSIVCFKAGLDIDQKQDNLIGMGLEYVGLGKSLFNASEKTLINAGIVPDKRNSLIISYLHKAISIGRSSQNKITSRDAYEELSKFYEKQGELNKAFENYRNYIALKDSIMNIQNSNAVSSLQIQYDTEKKEQQIALLTKESQLQQTNLQKQASTRNVFIVAFALIALLAGIIYNRYRIKQKANTEIEKTLHHLKTTQEQLVEHEKLATLGKFTAEVAREMELPVKEIKQLSKLNKRFFLNIKSNNSINDTEALKNNLKHIFNYGKEADEVVKRVLTETRRIQG